MHKQVRELVEWAEGIDFQLAGIDGQGHYILRHRKGSVRIPATPSDWRGDLNAKAQMRRIAGVSNDGPKAAKYQRSNLSSGFDLYKAGRESKNHARERERAELARKAAKTKKLVGELEKEIRHTLRHIAAIEAHFHAHGTSAGLIQIRFYKKKHLEDCVARYRAALRALDSGTPTTGRKTQ